MLGNTKVKKDNRLFTGPIFLVGMPRSGTKLLRGLLVEHSRVSIPPIETEFLPYWVQKWHRFGDLSEYSQFKKVYRSMMSLPYFLYMQQRDNLIPEKTWFKLCPTFSPAGVFEALLRHDAEIEFESPNIWGDKSPSYISHLPLLKALFPRARFIHITRDVRDYCLSIKKAWGKNMIRAAQRWTDCIHKIRQDSSEFRDDYLEIKYEQLIETPEHCLKQICAFLEIEFEPKMLHLSQPPENIGDTKNESKIVGQNKEKYLRSMKPSTRRRIEAIAAPILESSGYTVIYVGTPVRVPGILMLLYQVLDGFNLVKSNIKERGIIDAIRFHIRYFLISGNRTIDKT